MHLMIATAITISFTILNLLRGAQGYRALVVAGMSAWLTGGLVMEHALDGSLLYAAHLILSFLTLWLLFVFGWGEYFPVTWNPPARKEVVAIDRITDVLFMNSGYRGIWWKTVAMSLRWSLLGIPYWATQAVFSGEYGRAAIAAGSLLLAGPAYWTMNLVKGDTAPADLIMGLLLGAASITIWYPIGI